MVPDKDGLVLRDHYDSLRRQLGDRFKQPDAEFLPLPRGGDYLLKLFFAVNTNRRFTTVGMGESIPLPLADGELLDYQMLHADKLHPWEVELLKKLDRVYLSAIREKKAHGVSG